MITKPFNPPLAAIDCQPPACIDLKRFSPGRLFAGAVLATLFADSLLWGVVPGAALAVFMLVVWAVLLWNRSPSKEMLRNPKDVMALSLMLATAAQTAIETGFANVCLLLVLTVYASGHFAHHSIHPYWRRLLEGIAGLVWLPASLMRSDSALRNWRRPELPVDGLDLGKGALRCLWAVLPAFVLCIPFALLLLGGNAILFAAFEETLNTLVSYAENFEMPDLLRVIFWMFLFGSMLALLGKGEPSRVIRWVEVKIPGGMPAPADLSLGIWRTRILLVAVNVLFFFANSTDALFLWAEVTLPDGVTASDFVHQGVYSLIASVLLAALVISLLFVQSKEVCCARGQRFLAHLWIVQNLVLVSSVVLRLRLYVDFYQLSLLRVYVVCFLILVSVGFVLLAIRVHQQRTMSWLVGANSLAVFSLFFFMQCWDEHRFVAKWNVDAALADTNRSRDLDVSYLGSLGPAAWPVLQEVTLEPDRFGRHAAAVAAEILKREEARYRARMAKGGWLSWQWRSHVAAQQFALGMP